jgi:hypothetical protein
MSAVTALRLRSVRNTLAAGLVGLLLVVLAAPFSGPHVGGAGDLRRAATTVLDDRALVRSSGWRSASSAKAYLHTLTKSTRKGATLTSSTATTAGGSVRLQFGPGRGKVGIWVGGVKVRSVRTARATRKLVTVTFGGSGGVVLKVARPRNGVYVDKLTVSSPEAPVLARPTVGQIVITEMLSDPNGTDDAKEWFELTNVTGQTLSLGGCVVSNDLAASTVLPALSISPGGILLLARSADSTQNGGLPAVAATFGFPLNTLGLVQLDCGDVMVDRTATLFGYEGFANELAGAKTNAVDNDDTKFWCALSSVYGTNGDVGSPGASNPTTCS